MINRSILCSHIPKCATPLFMVLSTVPKGERNIKYDLPALCYARLSDTETRLKKVFFFTEPLSVFLFFFHFPVSVQKCVTVSELGPDHLVGETRKIHFHF